MVTMKTHALINLYNDRTFLAACLESIKPIVEHIIVADGAYTTYLDCYKEFVPTAKPFSTDGSIQILKGFEGLPDLTLLQREDCWPNQTAKRNALVAEVPVGDCFIIIDADEMAMGDVQEAIEGFLDSGCVAMQNPLYTPGLNEDRVIPKWHPRVFIKKQGMKYEGTHWHLRDAQGRIIEEKYPMHYTDKMAIVHFKSFKDQSRLFPHQNYMLKLAEHGWVEPTPGPVKEGEQVWKKESVVKE